MKDRENDLGVRLYHRNFSCYHTSQLPKVELVIFSFFNILEA